MRGHKLVGLPHQTAVHNSSSVSGLQADESDLVLACYLLKDAEGVQILVFLSECQATAED